MITTTSLLQAKTMLNTTGVDLPVTVINSAEWHEKVLLSSCQLNKTIISALIDTHSIMILARYSVKGVDAQHQTIWTERNALLITEPDLTLFGYLVTGDDVRGVEYMVVQARDFDVNDLYLPCPTYNWDNVTTTVNAISHQIEQSTEMEFRFADLEESNELNPFGSVCYLPNGKKVVVAWGALHVREMNDKGLTKKLAA